MIKPRIDAKQALKDIRAGLDDAALMNKYNLSSKGLQSLYGKLMAAGLLHTEVIEEAGPSGEVKPGAGVREVSAKSAIMDIKAGMSDEALMGKYRVSATGLQNMFEQLLDAGLITEEDLEKGKPPVESTVDISPTVEAQAPPLGPEESAAGETIFPPTVLLDQPDIDTRVTTFEKTIKLVWECPACAVRQAQQFDVCPECGVEVEEYLVTRKAAEEEKGPGPDAETAELKALDKQREMDLRREVEELRQLDRQREPEEKKDLKTQPEPTVPEDQDDRTELIREPEPYEETRRIYPEEEEEAEIVEELEEEEPEEEEEEVVDVPEEITIPRAQPERIVERIWLPLEIDPVVALGALKAEIDGASEELHKELYPTPTRLAAILKWIAHIQLALILIHGAAWILAMIRTGFNWQTLLVFVLFPILFSVVAFVLMRALSAGLQVAVDAALFQAKNTALLSRLIQGLNRGRD